MIYFEISEWIMVLQLANSKLCVARIGDIANACIFLVGKSEKL
jgi:hypothetical protein